MKRNQLCKKTPSVFSFKKNAAHILKFHLNDLSSISAVGSNTTLKKTVLERTTGPLMLVGQS